MRIAIVAALLLIGCASPSVVPIVPIGTDTYMLTKEDHAGILGSLAKLKADVISEATAFAASKGKVAVPVSFREKPVGNRPGDWASIEYQFKLVESGSDEAKNQSLNADRRSVPIRPDVSIQKEVSADIRVDSRPVRATAPPTAPTPVARDVYTELLKLDDLRKRGIINDAEFNEQKAKLLSGK